MKNLILYAFALLMSLSALAQEGWNWGDDKPEAQQNWMFIRNYYNAEKYAECTSKIKWFMEHAPELNEDLYKIAATAYQIKARDEESEAKKKELQDSTLMMYDLRIKHFGNKAEVLNRKGLLAYPYKYKEYKAKGDFSELAELYSTILELNKEETFLKNFEYYMKSLVYMRAQKKMTEEQLLEKYQMMVDILDSKTEKNADDPAELKKIDRTGSDIVEDMGKVLNVTCEFVEQQFGEKFNQNPDNTSLLKLIVNLMKQAEEKCYESDLYIKAYKKLYEKKPSPKFAQYIALIENNNGNTDSALVYLNKAEELAEEAETKSEVYYEIAKIYNSKGNKSTARQYARKMAATGVGAQQAYTFIGDLYYNSFSQCQTENTVQSKSIFIATYNMYQKAGNSSKMAAAKENFPTAEEIFYKQMKSGDTIETGCWIGETVTLQNNKE